MQCQRLFLIVLLSAMFIAYVKTSVQTSEPSCPKKMDLLFLVDGSVNNWQSNKMKEFLVKFVEKLDVSTNHTKVALAIFAKDFHLKWCFDEYLEKSELLQAVSDLSCPECERDQTVTGEALEAARTQMFVPGCGVREGSGDVARVVVVLTNEKSTETTSQGFPEDWVESQAQLLRAQVKEIFAIGVGNFDKEQLLTIADNENKVFTVKKIGKLTNKLSVITRRICYYVCEAKIDWVFLLDKSGSITTDQWELQKRWLKDVIDIHDVRPGYSHVAVAIFDRGVRTKWCFNDYPTKEKIYTAVKNLRCRKCRRGKTVIGAALKHTRESILQPECGVRNSSVIKQVVIFTEGKSTEDSAFWRAEAAALRNVPGTFVIAIGVGEYQLDNLQEIASHHSVAWTPEQAQEKLDTSNEDGNTDCRQ